MDLAEDLHGQYLCAENGRHYAIGGFNGQPVLRFFGMPMPLEWTADETLRASQAVLEPNVVPVRDVQNRVVGIDVIEQGCRHRCNRVERVEAVPSSEFDGRWRSDEMDATVVVDGDEMTVQGRYGRNRFRLEALDETTCLLSGMDPPLPSTGTLRWVQRGDGQRELMLATARIWGLPLHQV